MITSYLRAGDGSLTTANAESSMRDALQSGESLLWVDIEAMGRDQAALLSEVFGFHHLAIDDCFNRHLDPAKIDDYGDYLFIVAQAMTYEGSERRLQASELDLFLGKNYVVSFHNEPLHFITQLRRRIDEGGRELSRGAGGLAHSLLDMLVDDYQPVVEALDDALQQLEERVLEQPEQKLLQDVLMLKRNVQQLRRTIIPQRDVINRFARGEFPEIVRPEHYMYFRDIYDHIVRVEQLSDSVRDLADGALNTYLSSVNNRMNEVMKTLSVVASVLLPLTFIASIYGMNFEHMPELGWDWGYYWALGTMALLATGLVAFFRLRRWF
jgi:magnesium transporter